MHRLHCKIIAHGGHRRRECWVNMIYSADRLKRPQACYFGRLQTFREVRWIACFVHCGAPSRRHSEKETGRRAHLFPQAGISCWRRRSRAKWSTLSGRGADSASRRGDLQRSQPSLGGPESAPFLVDRAVGRFRRRYRLRHANQDLRRFFRLRQGSLFASRLHGDNQDDD